RAGQVYAMRDICPHRAAPLSAGRLVDKPGEGETIECPYHGWRFRPDGTPDPGFVLNDPAYAGARFLIGGANFGCGSSREHAPWALLDYGFRVLVAPSYADIFYQNCFKNGILPIILPEPVVASLAERAQGGRLTLTVDVPNLTLADQEGNVWSFALTPYQQETLVNGWDDIDRTLRYADAIDAYEARVGR
ncbi:MAG: 3-isopropylmalate dehydratase small subunit, partial [Firmicutes bacterium]|nr:3-isopropylmalate dehydratase small subunit [Bacillota bacterium]